MTPARLEAIVRARPRARVRECVRGSPIHDRSPFVLVLAWLAGCGAAAPASDRPVVQLSPDVRPYEGIPPVDPVRARQDVLALLATRWERISSGDLDGAGATLAPDVFLWGTAPDDVIVSRAADIAFLHRHLDPVISAGGRVTVRSTRPDATVAPDGRAAWLVDEPTITITMPGQPAATVSARVTAFAVRHASGWLVTASHTSLGVPMEHTAVRSWRPLHPLVESVASGSEPFVAAFRQGTTTLDALGAQLTLAALLIGTAADQHISGAAEIRQLFAFIQQQAAPTVRLTGPLRAGVSPGGGAGWVAANMEVSGEALPGTRFVAPLRVLAVYVREGEAVRLAQIHWSHGVPADAP